MAAMLFATIVTANAQEPTSRQRLHQSPPVLARYPDIGITLDTPALRYGRTTLTSQTEMEAVIDDLVSVPKSSAHAAKLELGITPGRNKLLALMLSREVVKTPAQLAGLGRPIVWLIGQQHGNEPAGGEAMLALAKALANGELTPLLEKISVVIVPRANPDGAAVDTRENASGADINRDHGTLTQPEVRMLHALVRQLPPALVVDAHEFTVGRRWVSKLGGLQAVDMMVLSATHPMVASSVRRLADEVFQPALEAAVGRHGLTSFVYHTTSARAGDRSISVGGNAPGIARNAFGLMGAVSFLIETRGVGVGMEGFQRRVAAHYLATKAVLEVAAARSAGLQAAVTAVRAAESGSVADIVVAHSVARNSIRLPLIDPLTGRDKFAIVDMLDTRVVTDIEARARPAGYLIPAARAASLLARIELMGGSHCALSSDTAVAIERYEIFDRVEADRRAINPDRSLSVRILADHVVADRGDVFIPLDQPAGTRLALALEPDAPGSLSALELAIDGDGSTLALIRVPRAAMTPSFAEKLACTR